MCWNAKSMYQLIGIWYNSCVDGFTENINEKKKKNETKALVLLWLSYHFRLTLNSTVDPVENDWWMGQGNVAVEHRDHLSFLSIYFEFAIIVSSICIHRHKHTHTHGQKKKLFTTSFNYILCCCLLPCSIHYSIDDRNCWINKKTFDQKTSSVFPLLSKL